MARRSRKDARVVTLPLPPEMDALVPAVEEALVAAKGRDDAEAVEFRSHAEPFMASLRGEPVPAEEIAVHLAAITRYLEDGALLVKALSVVFSPTINVETKINARAVQNASTRFRMVAQ